MIDRGLVRFHIPAAFVVARVLPTGAEMAYGFRHGWLSRADVVAIALAKYQAGKVSCESEETLALLLSDDLDHVDDLLAELEKSDQPFEEAAQVWLFLALSWLWENRHNYSDPFEVVEMLYADFGYPDAIKDLVRYMPAPSGQAVGLAAIDERWERWLDLVGDEYRHRRASPQRSG